MSSTSALFSAAIGAGVAAAVTFLLTRKTASTAAGADKAAAVATKAELAELEVLAHSLRFVCCVYGLPL